MREENGKRKVWFKARVYTGFSGLCGRTGKCVEVPIYVRAVRWRRIYSRLYAVFADFGISDSSLRIFGGTCKSEKLCGILS